jgi:putative membrane protein insertion efficiency factor
MDFRSRFCSFAAAAAVGCIRLYQWTIRPLIGPRCRFLPHCSDYAIESYQRHGLFGGSWLTAKRLGRCHPWCKGGLDPVPEILSSKAGQRPSAAPQSISSQ